MPSIPEALQRLDRELARARQENIKILKLIHGYGSRGAGGDIRIAVQKKLYDMQQGGHIGGFIFGEDWAKSNEDSWRLLGSRQDLKSDADLGRNNQGITIVML
jgi:hypothetical protein